MASEAKSNDTLDWRTAEETARNLAHAKALREQARAGGLRFSVYLPPKLADWLLSLVEDGTFGDPGEAAFVMLGEHREMELHRDLWAELLRRRLEAAVNDPRPGIPAEEVLAKMEKRFSAGIPEPAEWNP